MPRKLVSPPALHRGPGFSHVAVAEGSRTIHFAGQVAFDPEFHVLGGGAKHPAQTLIGATGLAVPGLLIEFEATASVA